MTLARLGLLSSITTLSTFSAAFAASPGLNVKITAADGILNGSTNGRVLLLFAPAGADPLDNLDVKSSPNYFFGKSVYDFDASATVTLSGGSGLGTDLGVWGYPNVSMHDIPAGDYTIQAYLNQYDTVTRSDGSKVSIRFPCGDGNTAVAGAGSLTSTAANFTVNGGSQIINLTFTNKVAAGPFNGTEIGGCYQGNYLDTDFIKYIKIRSHVLSKFWNRDIYVGANIQLPYGYNANDSDTRYPVIYSQSHWKGGRGAFVSRYNINFTGIWNSGTIPGVNGTSDRATPKLILVTFRHEAPFYDDSYAVNTANLGPYGNALNDELIPEIDKRFNTIAKPYARIQEGGSTGGWESAANLIFRPDLFGACFSSYPDSLDFHRHQDIQLYDSKNAYTRDDGSIIYSSQVIINDTLTPNVTTAQENHWELAYGTSSRSALQWDIWNAVFGVQGLNNYPLEPWDKVTGEIYPDAVALWKPMDLSHYVTSNWNGKLNLGKVLQNRIFIYVGSWDTYFLNEGVMEFQKRVEAKGGPNWANVTIIPEKPHGGNYNLWNIWYYLEFLEQYVKDHAPDGKTPLSSAVTTSASRGNKWEDVIAYGGHKAALARQASPKLTLKGYGKGKSSVEASVGRWDPGVSLEAQWIVDGKPSGKSFTAKQGQKVKYKSKKWKKWKKTCLVQLAVTGRKRGYADDTRKSGTVEA